MRCTVCDEEIPADSLFCPNCGTRVAATSSAGEPTIAAPSAAGEAAPPRLAQPYEERAAPQWAAPGQPLAAPQWASSGTLASPAAPNSTTAVVSLVFGILSWFALPVIGPIVAVIAGHMARAEIRRSNGQLGGGGMATAGLILGYLQIALLVLGICAFVGIFVLALLGGMSTAP